MIQIHSGVRTAVDHDHIVDAVVDRNHVVVDTNLAVAGDGLSINQKLIDQSIGPLLTRRSYFLEHKTCRVLTRMFFTTVEQWRGTSGTVVVVLVVVIRIPVEDVCVD